jgi:hypothetical protein
MFIVALDVRIDPADQIAHRSLKHQSTSKLIVAVI